MPHGLPQPILIVDDVVSEAMALNLLCRSLGAETASAAEAGAVLTRMRPAAIITDLLMPGADGLDCLFMIAEHASTPPVMVVTASEKVRLKAAGELGERYGLIDLTCVALRDFVARTGIPFKRQREVMH